MFGHNKKWKDHLARFSMKNIWLKLKAPKNDFVSTTHNSNMSLRRLIMQIRKDLADSQSTLATHYSDETFLKERKRFKSWRNGEW